METEKIMSKKIFTEKEIKQLSTNKYVKSVSQKESLIQMNLNIFLLLRNEKGNLTRDIFEAMWL